MTYNVTQEKQVETMDRAWYQFITIVSQNNPIKSRVLFTEDPEFVSNTGLQIHTFLLALGMEKRTSVDSKSTGLRRSDYVVTYGFRGGIDSSFSDNLTLDLDEIVEKLVKLYRKFEPKGAELVLNSKDPKPTDSNFDSSNFVTREEFESLKKSSEIDETELLAELQKLEQRLKNLSS